MRWHRVVLVAGLLAGTTVACGSGSGSSDVDANGPDRQAASAVGCDGGLVLVASKSAGEEGSDLVGLTADGKVQQLTNDGGSYGGAVSPDGQHVVFASVGQNGEVSDSFGPAGLDLYVIGANGTGRRRLLDGLMEDAEPDWSPDGDRIAFVESSGEDSPRRSSEIHVVNVDGSGARKLVPGDGASNDVDPVWSPDGKRLAFLRRTSDRSTTEVMVADADGSGARVVHETADQLGRASWSPDGARLAFPAMSIGDGIGPIVKLAVLDLGNGSVTDGPAGIDGVAWAPSGRLYGLARPPAVVDRSGNWRVAELEPDGRGGFAPGRAISAIDPVYFLYTDYGVDVAACVADGSAALTTDGDVPESLMVTDPATGEKVSVLTREQAVERASASYSSDQLRNVSSKLLAIDSVGPDLFIADRDRRPLIWFVTHKQGTEAIDAITGEFLTGGGITVPDGTDLAP